MHRALPSRAVRGLADRLCGAKPATRATTGRRTVLVTGAASGLGLALVRRFAARGDEVLATDRAATLEEGILPDGVAYRRLDVTCDDDWAATRAWVLERFGHLDLLVNNAGVAVGGRIDVSTPADWERVVAVNLLGVARGCHAFASVFTAQRAGHVVMTASLAGLVHGPQMAAYSATKAGVVAIGEALRYELAPWDVRVSVICPSFFRTGLAASLDGADVEAERTAARLIAEAPRSADEVAERALAGIDAGRPLILTDRDGHLLFWTKRLLRPAYDAALLAAGRRAAREPAPTETVPTAAAREPSPTAAGPRPGLTEASR